MLFCITSPKHCVLWQQLRRPVAGSSLLLVIQIYSAGCSVVGLPSVLCCMQAIRQNVQGVNSFKARYLETGGLVKASMALLPSCRQCTPSACRRAMATARATLTSLFCLAFGQTKSLLEEGNHKEEGSGFCSFPNSWRGHFGASCLVGCCTRELSSVHASPCGSKAAQRDLGTRRSASRTSRPANNTASEDTGSGASHCTSSVEITDASACATAVALP